MTGEPDPLLDPPSWAPSWLPTIDDVRGMRLLRWLIGAVLAAGMASCVSEGADQPADPVIEEPGTTGAPVETTEAAGSAPAVPSLAERFGAVLARLVDASGEVVELCLLHADTPDERAQGLMQVTDLQGHDGMLFAVDEPSSGAFYMYRTVLPLTIGWFDEQGGFVSRADMAPCPSSDPAACDRYPPGGPWRWAIEVEQGAPLAERFVAGASLSVTADGCRPRAT